MDLLTISGGLNNAHFNTFNLGECSGGGDVTKTVFTSSKPVALWFYFANYVDSMYRPYANLGNDTLESIYTADSSSYNWYIISPSTSITMYKGGSPGSSSLAFGTTTITIRMTTRNSSTNFVPWAVYYFNNKEIPFGYLEAT